MQELETACHIQSPEQREKECVHAFSCSSSISTLTQSRTQTYRMVLPTVNVSCHLNEHNQDNPPQPCLQDNLT